MLAYWLCTKLQASKGLTQMFYFSSACSWTTFPKWSSSVPATCPEVRSNQPCWRTCSLDSRVSTARRDKMKSRWRTWSGFLRRRAFQERQKDCVTSLQVFFYYYQKEMVCVKSFKSLSRCAAALRLRKQPSFDVHLQTTAMKLNWILKTFLSARGVLRKEAAGLVWTRLMQ